MASAKIKFFHAGGHVSFHSVSLSKLLHGEAKTFGDQVTKSVEIVIFGKAAVWHIAGGPDLRCYHL